MSYTAADTTLITTGMLPEARLLRVAGQQAADASGLVQLLFTGPAAEREAV